MKHAITLLRRGCLALLLAAFIVPSPVRVPTDDARAQAIALGLLCIADGSDSGAPHASGHCVLCLAPATGAAPETAAPCRPQQAVAHAAPQPAPQHITAAQPTAHQPRAPPALPV